MENSTKTRILEQALVSFAENGYKGTNLRDLASGLGITKSALYRHYDSKEEIWNAVIDMMEEYYSMRFGSPEKMPAVPESCDELLALTMKMLHFTMHDRKVILTRRLLLAEQFRDERARKLTTLHFLTGTKQIFTEIFARMMEKGILKNDDPEMLAFAYTAPVSALVQLCDREPEREAEITLQIEAFARHFINTYKAKDDDND
ncbi:MAG: TetR/AcrR family transcriptional regulator [Clostridia bacterium]|nr:TetR/AcrR family transcriptional regulator [Clostridia bacterium]